jgi:hypothetical protein
VSVFADATPLAVVTTDVVFDEDAVTFGDAVQLLELLPRHRDGADVLVSHDDRRVERRCAVHLYVRPADARDLDPQQGGVICQLGHRQLTQFSRIRCGPHGGQDTLSHLSPLGNLSAPARNGGNPLALWSGQYTIMVTDATRDGK